MTAIDDVARDKLDEFVAMSEQEPLLLEEEADLEALAKELGAEAVDNYNGTPEAEREAHLPEAVAGAFNTGRYALARELAERALADADQGLRDWNYGNLVFAAHSTLGLLALDSGDVERAVAELHLAGATPGSPQLDTFGPGMQLARALLRAGQAEAVLEYFTQCRSFWRMGGPALDTWTEMVQRGRIPNFFQQRWR